jgi:hypothetical protein
MSVELNRKKSKLIGFFLFHNRLRDQIDSFFFQTFVENTLLPFCLIIVL